MDVPVRELSQIGRVASPEGKLVYIFFFEIFLMLF